jgi:Bacterial protein of unknown function (DUF916)
VNRTTLRLTVSTAALMMALATVAQGSAAFAASAPVGAGAVSVRPEHPSAANPSYFTLSTAAGTTVHDAIVIANPSTSAVSLIISPVDGLTGQTSGSVFANRQDKVYKAGAWVTPELATLDLAPGTSRTVGFSVSVPAGTPAGDHLAGIAVENTQPVTSSNGFAIKQILRNVIGVLVIVPGSAIFTPHLASLGIQQLGTTGIGAVNVGLSNAGTRLAKPKLTVALVDTDNATAYHRTLTRELDTLLPGDLITYPFAWPDRLQKGRYQITATLAGGGSSVTMTRTFQLGTVLAGVTQPLPVAIVKSKSTGLQLWELIAFALGAALLFGLVTGFVVRRGHRRADTAPQV